MHECFIRQGNNALKLTSLNYQHTNYKPLSGDCKLRRPEHRIQTILLLHPYFRYIAYFYEALVNYLFHLFSRGIGSAPGQ